MLKFLRRNSGDQRKTVLQTLLEELRDQALGDIDFYEEETDDD